MRRRRLRLGHRVKQIPVFVIAATMAVSVMGALTFSGGGADDESSPIFGIKIPPGYRDWRLISVAHEERNLNDGENTMTTLAAQEFDHLMDATALIFGPPWQGPSADRLRS